MNKNALILVDIQNDFLPGGTLPVPLGYKILPIVNQLVKLPFDYILASKDWHPEDHLSFATNHHKAPGEKIICENLEQILWPVHCVQKTHGAEFAKGFDTAKISNIFLKGTAKNIDSYSAFFDNLHKKSTGLAEFLQSHDVNTVYIAGLATDYCIKYSVIDALHLGFNVFVALDACKGINLQPDDSNTALKQMQEAGAVMITLKEINKALPLRT